MRQLLDTLKVLAVLASLPFLAIWILVRFAPDIFRASIIRNLHGFSWITLSTAEEMARMHGLRSSSDHELLYRTNQRLRWAYKEGYEKASHARWVANLDEESRRILKRAGID